MRRLLVLCALGLTPAAQGSVGVCGLYRDAYQAEIKAKIQGGVPFELMSAVFVDGKLVDKRAVRIAFNLWDEVVTVKDGDRTLGRFSMPSADGELCKYLDLDARKGHYTYRLLLNPLWGERITRLQVANEGTHEGIMGINWRKLAGEMPSDKILIEREF